jgi:hypothetical protein
MSGSVIAAGGVGPVGPQRIVPPLPAGIPILPGQITAPRASRKRRWIALTGIAGAAALIWLLQWYSSYDGKRIEAVVTPAMFAHAKFGTRIPVTLMGGPRILSIGSSYVEPGVPPVTCVGVYVYDPKTGAIDPGYRNQYFDCIKGLAYRIAYPIAH